MQRAFGRQGFTVSALGLNPDNTNLHELALRYSAYAPSICSAIVGTSSFEHLQQNLRYLARGPLPASRFESLRKLFRGCDVNWVGQI